MEQTICNLDDLYILLGRMTEEQRKECEAFVRVPGVCEGSYSSTFRIIALSTEGEKPDHAEEWQPILCAEN